MLALTIEDQKLFNRELFAGTAFDTLRCCKVVIHHNVNYTIEGQYNPDYFSSEEKDAKKQQVYASWSEIKPIAFQVIKGNHLPIEFQIVLCAG